MKDKWNWKNRTKIWIGVISGMAFAVSLVYSFFYRIPPVVDAHAYDVIAVNILNGHGFREDVTKAIKFDPAIVRAGPGYEYVLAGIYAMVGHRYEAVWIFQALLHGLSTVFLFLICQRLFRSVSNKIGLLAAAFFGFSPDLIEISAMLMSETLYLFLVIVSTYIFILVYQRPRSLIRSLVLGIALGLAVLCRPPVGLFIAGALVFYGTRKLWFQSAVFLFSFAIVLTPWTLRNYRIYQIFIPTTLIGSYNLWLNNLPESVGGQFSSEVHNPLSSFASKHGYAAVKSKATQEFLEFLRTSPWSFVRLTFMRIIRYFSLIRPMGFWFYQHGFKQATFVILSATWIALLFIFGFTGFLRLIRQRLPLFPYLIFFAATSPLVLIPTVVQSRYRFQIYPFLAIFASYIFIRLRTEWHQVKSTFFLTGGILLFVTGLDIALSSNLLIQRIRSFFSL